VFVLLLIAAFFTAFYMGRQVLMVFFGKPRSTAAEHAKESPALITVPLILLAVLSAVGGALNLPGISSLEHWLEHSVAGVEPGQFVLPVALGSLAVALTGILAAWLIYGRRPLAKAKDLDPLAGPLNGIYTGMERKWWVDELYRAVIIRPFEWLAGFLAQPIDQGGIDGAVNGIGRVTFALAQVSRKLQTGFVRLYALMMLLGVVAMLAFLLLR
jgi:NADH-quinone oxidoreductase subunit L